MADEVRSGRVIAYKGMKEQEEPPELIHGTSAALYTPDAEDVLITPARAVEKGWLKRPKTSLTLEGKKGAEILLPLLRRLGSFYQRGGKTTINLLDLTELKLPKGGMLRISLTDIPPESAKDLGELFEVVSELIQIGDQTEAYLDIQEPQEDCPFAKEVKNAVEKG